MKQDWGEIRDALRERLAALNEEIGAYPGPITGCDAQFNHLLEQRVRLNAELARLDAAAASADAGVLKGFIESCPFLTGNGQQDPMGKYRQ